MDGAAVTVEETRYFCISPFAALRNSASRPVRNGSRTSKFGRYETGIRNEMKWRSQAGCLGMTLWFAASNRVVGVFENAVIANGMEQPNARLKGRHDNLK